jgi:hypothetical protein
LLSHVGTIDENAAINPYLAAISSIVANGFTEMQIVEEYMARLSAFRRQMLVMIKRTFNDGDEFDRLYSFVDTNHLIFSQARRELVSERIQSLKNLPHFRHHASLAAKHRKGA